MIKEFKLQDFAELITVGKKFNIAIITAQDRGQDAILIKLKDAKVLNDYISDLIKTANTLVYRGD